MKTLKFIFIMIVGMLAIIGIAMVSLMVSTIANIFMVLVMIFTAPTTVIAHLNKKEKERANAPL